MGNVNIVPYFLVCGSSIPQICLIRIMAQTRKSHIIMKKEKNCQRVLIKLQMTNAKDLLRLKFGGCMQPVI